MRQNAGAKEGGEEGQLVQLGQDGKEKMELGRGVSGGARSEKSNKNTVILMGH